MGTESAARLVVLVATAVLLVGCTGDADEPVASKPEPSAAPSSSSGAVPGQSTPVEDEVYPDVGDPGMDALRYQLSLAWDPESRVLKGRETVRLRAGEGRRPPPARPVRRPDGRRRDGRRCGRGVRARGQGPGDLHRRPRGRAPHPGHRLLRQPRSRWPRRPSATTSAPSAGRRRPTAGSGRCRSRTAPTRGTPSTTSPPTRRSTPSGSPCPHRGSAWPTASWSSRATPRRPDRHAAGCSTSRRRPTS